MADSDNIFDHITKGDAPPAAMPAPVNVFDHITTDGPIITVRPTIAPDGSPYKEMTPAERTVTGMLDPVQGSAQLLAHGANMIGLEQPINKFNNWVADKTGLLAKLPEGGIDEQTRQREATIQQESPVGADPLRITGEILSPMKLAAPTRALGGASLLRRVGSAAVQGGTVAAMQPVVGKPGDFAGEKAAQAVTGAATGAVIPPGEAVAKWLGRWIGKVKGGDVESKAAKDILARIRDSQAGGGPTFQDMLDLINTASDKPWMLADMPVANLRSLLGRLARSPGEVKQIIATALGDRDMNAGIRVTHDVGGTLGDNSMIYTNEALRHARSIMSKPLFDKAMAGGSVAPLERQFEHGFSDLGREEAEAQKEIASAQNRITTAAARQSQAGNNVYAVNGANQDMRAAQAQLSFAQNKLTGIRADKAEALEALRQAQDDIATGKPGAVWSPYIQRLLKNPDIRKGINRGLKIEKNLADSERRPMNTTEYAIVGTNEHGEPIVGNVPTMRLLAVAKEGLDAMLQEPEFRDSLTGGLNKPGVALNQLRHEFLKELDDLNPDYRAAREQWAGETDSMLAMRSGQDIFKMDPDAISAMMRGTDPNEIRSIMSKPSHDYPNGMPEEVIDAAVARAGKGMSPGEREFFKLGAAAKIRQIIQDTGEKGDETRRLLGSVGARRRLRALFDSDAEFNKFFASLNAEHKFFDTWASVYGNSKSAERLADDQATPMSAGAHMVHAGLQLRHGNVPAALNSARRAAERLMPDTNPEVDARMGRILTGSARPAIEQLQRQNAGLAPPSFLAPKFVPGFVYPMVQPGSQPNSPFSEAFPGGQQ